ncbi:MAG: SDR family oxidoreductase [Bacilli bacterium]|nr:SDR family oxidoreductase [Bacilli bacterium]
MYPLYQYIGKKTKCKEIPIAFPYQHQDFQPGIEKNMYPRPISENPNTYPCGKLTGKVAFITGGDSGIGRAVSYLFAKEGADIVFVYLNEQEDAYETESHVKSLGRKCLSIMTDLTKEENVIKAVSKAVEQFGKIDILVNNCAVQFPQDSILNINDFQLKTTFETNVFSYFYTTKAVLPYLKKGSSIINTASITAYKGNKQLLDYSATKGAIVAFTRSLALNLVNQGIRVNAVAPGPIWTPLIPSSFSAEEVTTFGTDTSKVPMMRAGEPFEVAPSYLFLASDDSSYMSGQVLHPNGGDIIGS